MEKNKEQITVSQYFCLIFICNISLATVHSFRFSSGETLWDYLIPLLFLIPIDILLLIPAISFHRKASCSVSEYAIKHFQNVGKTVVMLYPVYFLFSAIMLLSSVRAFMEDIMPEGVNAVIILILLICGCVYGAAKGIEANVRSAFLIVFLIGISVILLLIFLFPSYSAEALKPRMDPKALSVVKRILILLSELNSMATLPILLPNLKGNIKRHAILYVLLTCIFLCSMLLLIYGAVGDYIDQQRYPLFRVIDGAAPLQRLDPLFILILICSVFCNISLLLISASKSISAVFIKSSYPKTVFFLGMLLLTMVLFLTDNLQEQFILILISAVINVFLTVIVPLLLHLHFQLHSGTNGIIIPGKASVFLFLAVMLVSIPCMSGCTSLQLNQRLIVQGIGIDHDDSGYNLTLITLDTSSTEENNKTEILFSNGNTIDKAVEKAETVHGKKLLLNQCVLIMMDQGAAAKIEDSLSVWMDSREIPKTVNLMVGDGSVKALILKAIEDYQMKTEDINALSDSKAVEQSTAHCSLLEVIASHNDSFSSLVLPFVRSDEATRTLYVKGGCLVSVKNGCRHFTEDEMTGYLILKNKSDKLFGSLTEKITVSFLPSIQDKKICLNILIDLKTPHINSPEQTEQFQQHIRDCVEACIQKTMIEWNTDILMLRRTIRNALNISVSLLEPKNILYSIDLRTGS